MGYKYYLPNEENEREEYTVDNNSIIIIGANGSGKSKLGAWMEQQDFYNTHRISAQRSLQIDEYISLKSYEQASNLLLYGNNNKCDNHTGRWGWDGDKVNYTGGILHDYEDALSTFMAIKNMEMEKYIKECKEKDKRNNLHDVVPEFITDKLEKIWNDVFPHRKISLEDAKVRALMTSNDLNEVYSGKNMSDGERVALYLIVQALSVPENKTLIIDEPEIHLHKSIMNRLWKAIENERKDCLFIYITHDTDFAASHNNATKIWVKEFNGNSWKWKFVENDILPEQLLLDILGNRKNVIFVEGTQDSYDTKMYSEIYKNYYVVPCGSCINVISYTKSMNSNKQLHNLKCYGIIDRDYRSEYEIDSYKEDNIFTVNIAEIENLFLVEELLCIVNDILGYTDKQRIENIKKYIIEDRFDKQINRQICEAVVSEMKYQFTTISISNKTEDDAKDSLEQGLKDISYDSIKEQQEKRFLEILSAKDYKEVLKVFNCKSLSTSIGHFFELDNKTYREFVIRQMMGPRATEIINALTPYLPKEVQN